MTDTTVTMATEKRRRGGKRRGREGWARLVGGHEASGLTVPQYCEREGVSTASFYRWRTLIGEGRDGDSTIDGAGYRELSGTGFLDLGAMAAIGPVSDAARPSPEAALTVRLDLGAGVVLTLSRG